MSGSRFDVIVVGARCAGSPTAMLLARMGHRVLLVDKATFPSDTISTHVVHPPGVASLRRWGLLDRVVATRCPAIDTYTFDFGPVLISGSPGTEASPVAYCPRRTVLDKILVDGAAEAGCEVREHLKVEELVEDDGRVVGVRGRSESGGVITELADVVIGADGLRSFVAAAVGAERYHERPPLLCGYYTYWSDFPTDGYFETYDRGDRGWAAAPTHDGLTLVVGGWPYAEFDANKKDIEGCYRAMFDRAPEFAERIRGARKEARFVGTAVPNFFRKPYGPGWALVGDAGYNRDFITAQGISDAFRDAEACANAVHAALTGERRFDDVMGDYQRTRDEQVLPMFEFTCQVASLAPPPPELQQLLAAVHGNREAMDSFVRVNAGVTSPAEFFAPENVGRILAAAG